MERFPTERDHIFSDYWVAAEDYYIYGTARYVRRPLPSKTTPTTLDEYPYLREKSQKNVWKK